MTDRFLPSANLQTLQHRSRLLSLLRAFFTENGYWECETPILSRDVVVDANLDPYLTVDSSGESFYLQTSPEAAMKRLLAAGATAIFQVSRVFRRAEFGSRHNPEFTMVEWYKAGDDHFDQMNFTESLVRHICRAAAPLRQNRTSSTAQNEFARSSYDEAFERHVGTRVLKLPTAELASIAAAKNIGVPPGLSAEDHDGWLNLLLSDLVEPQLGRDAPEFVFDYPTSQAALARIRDDDPPVAERFELYIEGLEICNGYHELTDAGALVDRTKEENERRLAAGTAVLPGARNLEAAMRHGIPSCSGVALGFDRLVMAALGLSSIDEVMAFPIDRA